MIEIQALVKSFRKQLVLRHVDARIEAGTITALLGPNGSGKSTLMKCILGLVRPDSGTIRVDGRDAIVDVSSRERIGYMAQIARYPDNLSPRQVIEMISRIRGGVPQSSIDHIVDQLELGPHLEKPMRILSGGSRQKVSAVIATMVPTQYLLMDEPTASLDPIVVGRLKAIIKQRREQGTAILISSHVLPEVQEIADAIVYLHEGEVQFAGGLADLIASSGTNSLAQALETQHRNTT